ncbi:unnamed protein product, partial [Ectocarpus sp. 12 AP-2014]
MAEGNRDTLTPYNPQKTLSKCRLARTTLFRNLSFVARQSRESEWLWRAVDGGEKIRNKTCCCLIRQTHPRLAGRRIDAPPPPSKPDKDPSTTRHEGLHPCTSYAPIHPTPKIPVGRNLENA